MPGSLLTHKTWENTKDFHTQNRQLKIPEIWYDWQVTKEKLQQKLENDFEEKCAFKTTHYNKSNKVLNPK